MSATKTEPTSPRYQTAIVAEGPGKLAIKHNVPVPALEPGMVLVKTVAVAINPADAKMLDYSAVPGAIHGYDFAGYIVALGENVPGHFAVGDRVAGIAHGGNKLEPGNGAFAEYVAACSDLLLKVPEHMSMEDAASLGTGLSTAALSFSSLQIPGILSQLKAAGEGAKTESESESERPEFVLVAGGSTASGTRAIQLLKSAGLRPIATCSPANYALVRRYGAEEVFDYKSPTCAADIRAYTSNELAFALDCVTQADTTQMCYQAIGRAGGRYVSLEPFRDTVAQTRPHTVEPSWVMALAIFGLEVALDGEYGRAPNPENRKVGVEAFTAAQALMNRNQLHAHPVKAMPGGWQGVVKGVDIIRNRAQSGQKLVYSVA